MKTLLCVTSALLLACRPIEKIPLPDSQQVGVKTQHYADIRVLLKIGKDGKVIVIEK
jgi:hypothetical protein